MSKNVQIAIAAVAVIIILILALLLSGIIPGLGPAGGPTPGAPSYNVTFTESGLSSGTSWSVTLAGSTKSSTTTSVVFSEKNGTYPFTIGTVSGYTANPTSGSVVVNGAAVSKAIAFTSGSAATFTVTFTESGLPSGTSWSATLSGSTLSSTTTSIAFTEANGSYTYTIGTVTGYTASPASGTVTVAGSAQSVPITFTVLPPSQYAVTFTETGLSSGTSWSVTLAGTTLSSTTTTVSFTKVNGSYLYTVGTVSGYIANPASGTVPVAGAAVGVTITFTKSTKLGGPAYVVTWHQTGLPLSDLWTVSCFINATGLLFFGVQNTGASTEFTVPDGTYFWFVGTSEPDYIVSPAFGNVTVAGAPVSINVKFLHTYAVNFTESGLSGSAEWKVTLNGTPSTSFGSTNNSFMVPNGTYSFTASAFGYTASPASGTVTVAGADVARAITFTALTTYAVTFKETGLTPGAFWYVTLNGSLKSSIAPATIVFDFPNGNYPFTVSASGYFSASPASGTITIASLPQTKSITFTALATYSVTFTETGLTSGTFWAVLLNATYNGTTAPGSIGFKAPVGKHSFSVIVSGFTASPASGTVTVTTSGATVAITFTAIVPPTTHTVRFNESGLPAPVWQVSLTTDGPPFSLAYACFNSTFVSTELNCSVPNGNYTWIASTTTPNYTASPMAGWLVISGAGATVSVTFVNSSADYLVWFTEQEYSIIGIGGIPNGSSWSVTLGGNTQTTQGTSLFFLVPTGTTAAYVIHAPATYLALPSTGNVTGYANPSQSADYFSVSPTVMIAFAKDPPAASPGPAHGSSPAVAFYGSLAGTHRDLLALLRRTP